MTNEQGEAWYGYYFTAADKQAVIQNVRSAQYYKQTPSGTPQEIYAKYASKYAQEHGLGKVPVSSAMFVAGKGGAGANPKPNGLNNAYVDKPLTEAESRGYYLASTNAAAIAKAIAANKANTKDITINDAGYRWNLPPHRWSLPYRPSAAYPLESNKLTDFDGIPDKLPTSDLRAMRRGRIRWRFASASQKFMHSDGTVSTIGYGEDRKYGFQFIWNPEQFSTTTAISYNTTPTAQDFAAAAPGWFPGVQSIAITIRLDRTNDFACFRGLQDITEAGIKAQRIDWDYWYPEKMPKEAVAISYEKKLSDLLQMGTMADVDYLLRTMNDPNIMKNMLGKVTTADAGFLSFNPVQFELGPLGYLGFIVGMTVNHIGFTEDYIPIRTDVTINANMMTNVASVAGEASPPAAPATRSPIPGVGLPESKSQG